MIFVMYLAKFVLYSCVNVLSTSFRSYKSELDAAGECMILMMEQSSKEVLGTTCIQPVQ